MQNKTSFLLEAGFNLMEKELGYLLFADQAAEHALTVGGFNGLRQG